jgi:DNA invertase Pin-like site-specific DNA recombinase
MKAPSVKPVRCAIYTRVSTEHGLDQEFNSLDAQYDAASAYIKSQAHAGWTLIRSRYDDGGYSGGSTDRPDLQRLLNDIRARKIDVIVVYKVDRRRVPASAFRGMLLARHRAKECDCRCRPMGQDHRAFRIRMFLRQRVRLKRADRCCRCCIV